MKWLSRVLCCVVLCGCIVQPIKPVPDDGVPTPIPTSKVDAAVEQAMKDYAAGLSKSFDEAASANYEKSSDASTKLATENKSIRQAAFAPVDAILDDAIGGEKWDQEKAAKLFRDLSEAFKKVK